jgi:hypothetical protein
MIYRLKKMKFLKVLLICLLVINLYSCFYSFTGASVPPHLKTIAIPTVEDRSGSAEPELRQLFTKKLTQKFIDDNTLRIADKSQANAILECAIQSVTEAPNVVSSTGSNDAVTSKKLTISVRVINKDLVKKKIIYERTFSNSGTYSSTGDITSQRRAAMETAVDLIADDILLSTVSNW